MRCVTCDGAGCDECGNKGTITITCCPLELITNDVWQIIQLVEFYEKGLPPIAGGTLQQAKAFNDAALFIMCEKQYWKSKLGAF